MKRSRLIPLLTGLTGSRAKKELLKQLQEQRQLLHTGLDGQAEVIHAVSCNRYVGRLQQVQLWLRLKRNDGSYIYTHSYTLFAGSQLPDSGHLLRIRYRPDNLSVVIIL